MQSPRNWRRRQSQHIHVRLELLDLLLVGYAKALLLVHHKKSQILEIHILGQDPMCSDYNVHLTLFQVLDGMFLFCRRAKTT